MSKLQALDTVIEVPSDLTEVQAQELQKMSLVGMTAFSKWLLDTEYPPEFTVDDRKIVAKIFETSGVNPTISVRRYVRLLAQQAILKKDTAPSSMVLDCAKANGTQTTFFPDKAILTDGQATVEILVSRVPVPPADIKNKEGKPVMRMGIDFVAASMGACTRWDGKAVVATLPMETLQKFKFTYLDSTGVKDFLHSVPRPTSTVGIRGRRWVYEIFANLQRKPNIEFLRLASEWYTSLFRLPLPVKDRTLTAVLAKVFALMELPDKRYVWVPADGFKDVNSLRSLDAAFPSTLSKIEDMYNEILTFSSVQQGDSSGIGMLASGTGSWGLVSQSHVDCERITSLICGMKFDRIVVKGMTSTDVGWIRSSVRAQFPSRIVYELVDPMTSNELLFTTSSMIDSLVIIKGPGLIATNASVTKTAGVRIYNAEDIKKKTWTHVEDALTKTPKTAVVYYGAFLPPIEAQGFTFYGFTKQVWNSVGFVSKGPLIFRGAQEGREKVKDLPIATDISGTPPIVATTNPSQWYQWVLRAMNFVISHWAVPPLHSNCTFANLMSPHVLSSKVRIKQVWDADEGEYVMHYVDVVEAPDTTPTSVMTTDATTTVADSNPPPQEGGVKVPVLNFQDDD